MPTNRRKLLRGRVVYTLTLDELTISEQIALWRCWYPSISVATRWKTWEEYFTDYEAVREELLADPAGRAVYGLDFEPFASRVRRLVGPGQVFDGHGHRALWHAHIFVPGDGHTHYDDGIGDGDGGMPPTPKSRVAVLA
jgi:hypothetical protein